MNIISGTSNWYRQNKAHGIILMMIIALGAFLRLYRIADYMNFLGDEGRDMIIVRRLLVDGDLILIGPGTSIGNMYLGPLYYYLIAPSLLLANFSPVGPSVMVALIGIATIALMFVVVKDWFGAKEALLVSLLYSVSPTVVAYSKFSWNPNIMPFFALLAVYTFWLAGKANRYMWLILSGISLAFALQSHYLGALLVPALIAVWIMGYGKARKDGNSKSFIRHSLIAFVAFVLLMSPLLLFDIRHGWLNLKALIGFISEDNGEILTVSVFAERLWIYWANLAERLIAGRSEQLGRIFSIAVPLTFPFTYLALGNKSLGFTKKQKEAHLITFIWMAIALIGFALYPVLLNDHYFGFVYPAVFLILAGLFHLLLKIKLGLYLSLAIAGLILFYSYLNSHLHNEPNRQLERTETVADLIAEKAGEIGYNLAVIADNNYEDAYQYFLERSGSPVVDIDPLRYDETVMEYLYAVCEVPKERCQPTTSPKAEIANFGWSKIDAQWEIDGITVYRLTHTK